MRPRVVLVLALAAILLGGVLLVPAAYARLGGSDPAVGSSASPGSPPPTVPPTIVEPPKPTLAAGPVSGDVDGFFSWALMDLKNGKIAGSPNSATATSSTESMIKVWIVSDFLRRTADKGAKPTKSRLGQASRAIRNSDDNAAESLFNAGGRAPVIDRMIKICGLTATKKVVPPGQRSVWWSYTEMTAQDVTRLGECVKSGDAAGEKWTEWVLTEMTKVAGTVKQQQARTGGGRWGIIDGLPAEIVKDTPVSMKNGWTAINADQKWHISCLAVTDDWVLAVQTRYPIKKGLAYGAGVCGSVATQLVTPKVGAALKLPAVPDQG
jgi:hypothetical protein